MRLLGVVILSMTALFAFAFAVLLITYYLVPIYAGLTLR